MFKKVEPLSNTRHHDLRFTRINSFECATEMTAAPLTASEILLASRYYPIVFPTEGVSPVALFALTQKKNFYVDNAGLWKVPYVPAHIRRYPFILANRPGDEADNGFAVCVDTEAPHFLSGQGDPLFTADGEPADVTQNAINFLTKFQEELKATQMFCQELEDQKILVPRHASIEKNGDKSAVGGFRCVDVEKLGKLEDEILAKWVRNGLVGLINSHLQSLSNLKRFV